MKILGIGVDIIQNKRIKNLIFNKTFLSRTFSKNELINSKKVSSKTNYFSKRFAAKEALAKSIGTGFRDNLNFKDIEILNDKKGKPFYFKSKKIDTIVKKKYSNELERIKICSIYAEKNGIEVHAGHGLDYKTTKLLSKINQINEFNIGHFIIGESIFYGLPKIIKKFKNILKK